jgi:hypothetical protein
MFDPFTYLKNKKCLLIGNSVLDKEPNYSDYEVIIRMNLGIMTKPCDVWIDNLVNQAHSFLLDKLGYYPEIKNIIRLNAEKNGKRMERMPNIYKPYAWLWNKEEYQTMCNLLKYQRPTTGLTSIYWLTNFVECDLTVTGYDFFKTPNRYTMETHAVSGTHVYPSHDINKDKYWIMKWAEQGLYKLI